MRSRCRSVAETVISGRWNGQSASRPVSRRAAAVGSSEREADQCGAERGNSPVAGRFLRRDSCGELRKRGWGVIPQASQCVSLFGARIGSQESSMGAQIRWFATGADDEAPVAVDAGAQLTEKEFHSRANATLDTLQEKIEAYGEDLNVDGFDLDYSDGVMTVRLGDLGTYVINKQTPNRQLWLSSPVSGPARFDWIGTKDVWVYSRSKAELTSLLEAELSKLLGSPISLKN